jgi:hypothetical protein
VRQPPPLAQSLHDFPSAFRIGALRVNHGPKLREQRHPLAECLAEFRFELAAHFPCQCRRRPASANGEYEITVPYYSGKEEVTRIGLAGRVDQDATRFRMRDNLAVHIRRGGGKHERSVLQMVGMISGRDPLDIGSYEVLMPLVRANDPNACASFEKCLCLSPADGTSADHHAQAVLHLKDDWKHHSSKALLLPFSILYLTKS